MRLDWLIHPFTYYSTLAAALAACLYLFITVQSRLTAVYKKCQREQMGVTNVIGELRAELRCVKTGIDELERRAQAAEAAALPQPGSAININKRAQVIRLAKRGERPDQIAATLRLPQNEVNLVLKVHRSLIRAL